MKSQELLGRNEKTLSTIGWGSMMWLLRVILFEVRFLAFVRSSELLNKIAPELPDDPVVPTQSLYMPISERAALHSI